MFSLELFKTTLNNKKTKKRNPSEITFLRKKIKFHNPNKLIPSTLLNSLSKVTKL